MIAFYIILACIVFIILMIGAGIYLFFREVDPVDYEPFEHGPFDR